MKKILIIIITFNFIISCSNKDKQKLKKKYDSIKLIDNSSNDFIVSKLCYEYDLLNKLKNIKKARLITFDENDLYQNLDSINNSNNFILNIFLNPENNIEVFQLLSQLKNPLGLRLNIPPSHPNRDGFDLLNNVEFLEIVGATEYHIGQLKNLRKLKMLHLEWALIDSFPLIFDNHLNLYYLNFTLSKIKNIPNSFTNQPCLEELIISKTNIRNLPLDNNMKKLRKLITYRAFGMYLPNNFDHMKSLDTITLDKSIIKRQKNLSFHNFINSSESNYETITYIKK